MTEQQTSPQSSVLIAADLSDLEAQNPIPDAGFAPKKIHRGEGFSITHIAFDAGIELAEHAAPVPVIVQIAEGSVDFFVEGTPHRLTQGAILHMAAGVRHAVHSVERSHVIVTFLG